MPHVHTRRRTSGAPARPSMSPAGATAGARCSDGDWRATPRRLRDRAISSPRSRSSGPTRELGRCRVVRVRRVTAASRAMRDSSPTRRQRHQSPKAARRASVSRWRGPVGCRHSWNRRDGAARESRVPFGSSQSRRVCRRGSRRLFHPVRRPHARMHSRARDAATDRSPIHRRAGLDR